MWANIPGLVKCVNLLKCLNLLNINKFCLTVPIDFCMTSPPSSYFPEVRMAEMSRMGMGSKPCLDLKPSKDNIQDRFINVNLPRGGTYHVCRALLSDCA